MRLAWWHGLILLAVIVGTWFRLVDLDRKIYWNDEVITSLRISGYSAQELVDQIKGKELHAADLHKYQDFNNQKTDWDMIRIAAHEDPHIPPFYYLCVREWAKVFGSTPASVRSFSAVMSVFALPLMFWFCLELFGESSVAWLALLFLALSPLNVLYAQEARTYSLYTVIVLASSLFLLEAIKTARIKWWLLYGLFVSLGLYSQPFFLYVAIAHAFYLWLGGSELRQSVKKFVMAVCGAALLFSPWLFVILSGSSMIGENMSFVNSDFTFWQWLKIIGFNLSRVFLDLSPQYSQLFSILMPLILIVQVSSLYVLYKKGSRAQAVFLLSLIAVTFIPLVAGDLAFGGHRAIVARYFFATYTGIICVCAFAFSRMIASGREAAKIAWQGLLALILLGAMVSCWMISNAGVWWSKTPNTMTPAVAQMINRERKPLVVKYYTGELSDLADVLTLSHLLSPNVSLKLLDDPKPEDVSGDFSEVLLYLPTENAQQQIQEKLHCRLVPMDSVNILWRVR